jgi:hypothetical protein
VSEPFGWPDTELLRQAVTNARSHQRRGRHQRWVAVMELFSVQHDLAKTLCLRFKLDPDEMVIP